jgi:hypothetical protein
MITEAQIKRSVRSHLDAKGYKEVDSRELHERGPDLVFKDRRNGRRITIEAKGDSRAKSGMENKILTAMGQTLARFHSNPNYYMGIAVPFSWKKRMLGKLPQAAMRQLQVIVYLVKDNGQVEEISTRTYRKRAAA